jgi:hypothetical protein
MTNTALSKHRTSSPAELDGYKYVTPRQGASILDRQARKYLGLSGDEFVRRYRAGEIADPVRPEVIRVAMLIPLTEG